MHFGDAFATDSATFERLQRIANSCERAYHRARKELEHHKSKVGQALPSANPEPVSQSAPQSACPDAPASPAETQPCAAHPEQKPPQAI
jgi:hypothetical protein